MPLTDKEKLVQALADFSKQKILVLGDIIIDHFIWGSVSRISPEAPVPVVNVTHESLLLGGSANVLNNVYSLGSQATICGLIGEDPMGDQLLTLLRDLHSPTDGIIRVTDRPTTKKTRIIAQHQQVVRFDREKTSPLTGEHLELVKAFISSNLTLYDAVIVSDYAKGIINVELMDHLRRELASTAKKIPLVIDPKPAAPERFRNASIITPNQSEAEKIAGLEITDADSLEEVGRRLLDTMQSEAVLITRGEAGMALFEKDRPLYTIPTVAKEVFDVTGAGDTVIATLALGVAAGLTYAQAAVLANVAAGIVVGKLGTATANVQELLKEIQ